MKENTAIGAICAGLLGVVVFGGVSDLKMASEAEQLMSAAAVLTQPACNPPIVAATYSDPSCASRPDPVQVVHYRARMDALAQN